MAKGTGPSGVGLDAAGNPAAGASLVLICNGAQQIGLNSDHELTAYWNKTLSTTADATGHFHFQPELGMKKWARPPRTDSPS